MCGHQLLCGAHGKVHIPRLTEPNGYEMSGVLAFPEHVPDRDRAGAAVDRAGPLCSPAIWSRSPRRRRARRTRRCPSRRCPARGGRRLFDADVTEAYLGHLAGAQAGDGGWTYNWPSWPPAAGSGWRGFLTVGALRVPRANGRA